MVAALMFSAAVVVAETPQSGTAELVTLYVPMQEALAGDSVAAVKEQAAKIASEAAAAAEAGGDKATLEAVAAAAKGMTATEIKALREQFKPLSLALAKMVEKQAVDGHGIYFCPMADAYWVQKQGSVANPYYGKSMLRCGEQVKKVEG
jgi:membrane fusion protein, copper/silver efflux system